MKLHDRLVHIESLLSRIDERTQFFANKITQQETELESLKKRHWFVSGATAVLVWLVSEWHNFSAFLNKQ